MIDRRVFGSETEFGIIAAFAGPPEHPPADWRPRFYSPSDDAVHELIYRRRPGTLSGMSDGIDPSLYHAGQFISNGGRLYEDCGHPEYATPEVTGLDDLVASELAAERIIMDYVRAATTPRDGERRAPFYKIIISKENTDHQNHSWGYHENYQTLREAMDPSKALKEHKEQYRLFGAHLLSRCIYAGEGGTVVEHIDTANRQSRFVMAPKLMLLTHDIDPVTVFRKPLINTRDEPHMHSRYTRQHVVSGGPNMSPWGTKMTYGTTNLVLSAIEFGLTTEKNIRTVGYSMHHAARVVSGDFGFKAKILTESGTMTSINMQEEMHAMARKVGERRQLTDDDTWVLNEWELVLQGLRSNPASMANHVEWLLKQELGAINNASARGWTALSETRSVADVLRKRRWSQWMPSEAHIQHLMVHAPADTRAAVRERFIRAFPNPLDPQQSSRYTAIASWAHLHLYGQGKDTLADDAAVTVPILNPKVTKSAHLEKLIANNGGQEIA